MQLLKTNNQHALVVRLLIEYHKTGISMKEVMQDFFHKFQTRLLELEKGRHDKLKIRRLTMATKNRFGHSCSYTNYKSLASLSYLINLHNKLCKQGYKAIQK